MIYLCAMAFLLSSCAAPQLKQEDVYKPPAVEWQKYDDLLRKIPNVQKMDSWLVRVHKGKTPKFKKCTNAEDGLQYVCLTEEDFTELLKILEHGRLGWDTASDLQHIAELQQEVVKQVIALSKIIEEQRDLYRDRYIDSENRYLALEHEVKINNVMHKITTLGLIGGLIMVIISVL